jgi:NhaP-type Na+/H+ or K+/H+ antiporter
LRSSSGLSIPTALEGIEIAPAPMIGYVAGALALVTATRFLLAGASAGRGRNADRVPRAKEGLMLAWGGGRTPLAFVIALLVPPTIDSGAPFPDRDLLLVFAAALVVASAALQGTTVAALARWLRLNGDDGVRREEQAARNRLAAARREHSRTTTAAPREPGEAFGAERAALVRLYDADEIGEETMLRLRQEIDLEEQRHPGGTDRPNRGGPVPR